MKLDTNTLLLIGGGLVIYHYLKNKENQPITPKKSITPKKPISKEDCGYGFTYQPQREIQVQCIQAPCPPITIPASCGKNRKSSRDSKIEKIGSWMPNDTSCTPCTTMQYQGNRTTARIHKSWCDLNCAVEVAQANKLRNPFGNLFNPQKN